MNALDRLRYCPDIATLKPALQGMCEKFGHVTRLDVLSAIHEGTRQAICFLRLESAEKEQVLMQSLGVGRFGGEIAFVVDLGEVARHEAQQPPEQCHVNAAVQSLPKNA
ncbi:MAG: RNA-binding protein [Polaromonas sp.]